MPTIFYAWQSDTPNNVNRSFIRAALDEAVQALNANITVEDALELDHDTQGVPGSPPIAETILEKIRNCAGFVADLTLVSSTNDIDGGSQTERRKYAPNANVLIEYGYALRASGPKRIVGVMNEAFGPADRLPFDLVHRRFPIRYTLPPDSDRTIKAQQRSSLVRDLERALSLIVRGDREAARNIPSTTEPVPALSSAMVYPVQTDGGPTELIYRPQPEVTLTLSPVSAVNIAKRVELKRRATSGAYPLQPLNSYDQSTSPIFGLSNVDFVTALKDEGGPPFTIVSMTRISQTGQLSGVDQHLLRPNEHFRGRRVLPTGALRRRLEKSLSAYVRFVRTDLGYAGQLRGRVGLSHVDGIPLVLADDRLSAGCASAFLGVEFDVIDEVPADATLRPFYESLWDACGEEFS